MSDPVYKTTRAQSATTRLIIFAAIGAIALYTFMPALVGGDAPFFYHALAVILGLQVISQIIMLLVARHPLVIYSDRAVISTFWRTTIWRKHVTGRGLHSRRGDVCLDYHDAEKGHKGQVTLPWKMVAEPADEVIAELDHFIGGGATAA